ncbi:MAG: class I SAM-dependent methyltransferase [Candidatus Cloacimonetes bacterium]|nr:class I SAM-dependent methyltransferase [Candidatus Cloacimonadota bacterium]
MNDISKLLSQIDGGIVLDAATGKGEFISVLKTHLKSYIQIIGVDNAERNVDYAQKVFPENDIEIYKMNLEDLQFEVEYFDLVCISNSLHHLEKRDNAVLEMLRVLKPGGTILITEMYCDGIQTPAQQTHIKMHHWLSGVDRLLGVYHQETYKKEELVSFAKTLGLKETNIVDFYTPVDNPIKNCESLVRNCKDTLKKLESIANSEDLIKEGKEMLVRLSEIGCASASRVLITGHKPKNK